MTKIYLPAPESRNAQPHCGHAGMPCMSCPIVILRFSTTMQVSKGRIGSATLLLSDVLKDCGKISQVR
ncbi:hypothetical protein MFRU_006g02990 [Monilinia fructicola]|nr:hypothetical protein MFRU_006g02990 [Monilinia fructicola]